jgi:hypothetical protein
MKTLLTAKALEIKRQPEQRATDGVYAPRFLRIFSALGFFRFEGESTLPPIVANASHSVALRLFAQFVEEILITECHIIIYIVPRSGKLKIQILAYKPIQKVYFFMRRAVVIKKLVKRGTHG